MEMNQKLFDECTQQFKVEQVRLMKIFGCAKKP